MLSKFRINVELGHVGEEAHEYKSNVMSYGTQKLFAAVQLSLFTQYPVEFTI